MKRATFVLSTSLLLIALSTSGRGQHTDSATVRTPATILAGETARSGVPMVSESWYATAVATPLLERQPIPLQHAFPHGFAEAKEKANARKSAASAGPSLLQPSGPALVPGTIFEGPNEFDSGFIPPDPQVAAGPDALVTTVNGAIGIYGKGGNLISTTQFSAFSAALGIPGCCIDPRVIYDQADDRFIITGSQPDPLSSHVLVAVSQTSDPTGIWNKYAVDFTGRTRDNTENTFADFPTLGLSSTAIYIGSDQVGFQSGFQESWITVIGLPELLSGSSTLDIARFKDVRTASGEVTAFIQGAVTYAKLRSETLVSADVFGGSVLHLFQINTSGLPSLSTTDIAVASYGMPPDASQPDTAIRIKNNGAMILSAVWRNGSLWCTQNVADDTGAHVVARWYEIATAKAAVKQLGTVLGSGEAYNPSIAVLRDRTAALAFTTSSETQFASAAFTQRGAKDPPNTMSESMIYREGTAPYTESIQRFGDYSGTSPDPGGGSIWGIAEYARTFPNYGTAVVQLTVSGRKD